MRAFVLVAKLLLLAASAVAVAGAVTSTAAALAVEVPASAHPGAATTAGTTAGATATRDFDATSDANIFGGKRGSPDAGAPLVDVDPGSCDDAPRSVLSLRLVGTVVASSADLSSATIADTSKRRSEDEADMFAVDDAIGSSGAVLKTIEPERVCVLNTTSGRLESLALDDDDKPMRAPVAASSSPPPSGPSLVHRTGPTSVEVPRDVFDGTLKNLAALVNDIHVVPAPNGFRVTYLKPSSVLAQAGLMRGDVLQRVNGYDVANADSLSVFPLLKSESHFNVDIDRKGTPTTLTLDVVR